MTGLQHFNKEQKKHFTVPCFPIILLFLGDHFGVDKKKSGDHFEVGIISGSIWGSFQGWDHFGGCTDRLSI